MNTKLEELINKIGADKRIAKLNKGDKLLLVNYLCDTNYETYKEFKAVLDNPEENWVLIDYLEFLKYYPWYKLGHAFYAEYVSNYEYERWWKEECVPEINRLCDKPD